ncbi:hypothetical protein EVAR_27810_1 [Eumeta japonica]|uniref:Uncharacterized protein n=1 Tax=Eumeta variegata TaxID=151549 RepID=A0A4C1VL77_EUMVA|nr:hypothetical protein EVAR_27810_1 [Eumeta japonica]
MKRIHFRRRMLSTLNCAAGICTNFVTGKLPIIAIFMAPKQSPWATLNDESPRKRPDRVVRYKWPAVFVHPLEGERDVRFTWKKKTRISRAQDGVKIITERRLWPR